MRFEVLHVSSKRVRIRVPFICSQAVEQKLITLASQQDNITYLTFYGDEHSFQVFYKKDHLFEVRQFLTAIDETLLKETYQEGATDPRLKTPFDIIFDSLCNRFAFRYLIPAPIRHVMTLYKTGPFIKKAYQALRHQKMTIEVLDCLAILTSISRDQIDTASTIMYLLNLGNDLGEWTQKKSINDLAQTLKRPVPPVWVRLPNGEKEQKDSFLVGVGDELVVEEGSEIFFDGDVVDGTGYVNESSLTGESLPVVKARGSKVSSNTVLVCGQLVVSVTNADANHNLLDLVNLMTDSKEMMSKHQQQLVEKADQFVKVNLMGISLTYLATGSFEKALSFLLVDFSCSLKIATPVSYLVAVKKAMESGVVVKGPKYIDLFPEIDTFIFDKTGTITEPTPKIVKIQPFYDYTEEEVIRIGACLEEHFYHPIANAIVQEAKDKGIVHKEMHGELEHVVAKGVRSTIGDDKVVIGNYKFICEEGITITDEQQGILDTIEQQAGILCLGYRGELIALFGIENPPRVGIDKVLRQLKESGKQVVLLTGDNALHTEPLKKLVEWNDIITDTTPKDKFKVVSRYKQEGHHVMMIGDGLNDSAALSEAEIGAVMSHSSDVARHLSDVIFLNDDLNDLFKLEQICEDLKHKLNRNLKWTVAINSTLIGFGILGILSHKQLALTHNMTTMYLIGKSLA